MMRTKKLLGNVIISFISQIIVLLLSFINRTVFVRYIGVEILGISSTITSLISTLSLAELGFQTAVVYKLYVPLATKDFDYCNELLSVLKKVYKVITLVVFSLLCILTPFLKYFFKGIEVNSFVYLIYILFSINSIVSYFIAYKRTLLYADGNDYIAKIIDGILNIVFTAIRIYVVIFTGNYILFLCITVFQTVLSNIIVSLYTKRLYQWVNIKTVDKKLLKDIFSDVKSIFATKIAAYVYTSTDNILISSFVNTVVVGYMANYTIITGSIKTIVDVVVSQIAPFLGKRFAIHTDKQNQEDILFVYTFIRFLIAGLVVIPIYLLTPSFIEWWLGEEYVLYGIVSLLCIDMYIHIVHTALCDYITISGKFFEEKKISIICAMLNLFISVVLVFRFETIGILWGTVISQSLFWILRGRLVFKDILHSPKKNIISYISKNIIYMVLCMIFIMFMNYIYSFIHIESFIVEFLLKGIICEISFLVFFILFFAKSKETKMLQGYFLKKEEGYE